MNWNEIKELKNKYNELLNKARSMKTKKSQEKYRDKALEIKKELSNELAEWNFSGLDFTQFNIMAPCGGPYCLVNAFDFKIETNMGAALQVSFKVKNSETRWAGYLHWIDNKCGIDNMKLIE